MTLGILSSGNLGFDTLKKILSKTDFQVKFIATDYKSETIIRLASEHNIPCFKGNPRNGRAYNFIKKIEVDVIISINYLFLIEEDLINHPNKLIFNIHGSLLPKYRGRTPHVWAIINGEKETGITAHIIDQNCDTGDILKQIRIPIEHDDTGGVILEKYAKQYFPIIKSVISDIRFGKIKPIKQISTEASYFGKRTPEDGLIDWNSSSEDIRNWVRAQAFPYPGAFTYYNEDKIIIDKVSKVDYLDEDVPFGKIVSIKPEIIVKSKNGFLKLDEIRTKNYNFKIGKRFNNGDWE